MGLSILTLGASKNYTDETVIGGGAIKGKNCVIQKIERNTTNDANIVTFSWTLDSGTVLTGQMIVKDGEKGDTGATIVSLAFDKDGKLVATMSDGTTLPAVEMPKQGIDVSKEAGNGLVKKADGYYVATTGVEISKKTDNALVNETDGLYVKKTNDVTISKETGNIIQQKSDGLYAKADEITISAKTDNIIKKETDGLYVPKADAQVQADFSQTDNTKADFIKNKPTVDQTYSATSENAQSGKAVASGIATELGKRTYLTKHKATKAEIDSYVTDPTKAAFNVIYLLKDDSAKGADKFFEYQRLGDETSSTFEITGDTSTDLTGYVKDTAIVKAFSTTPTDSNIPSEKLVQDSLDAKVDIQQKATDAGKVLKIGTDGKLAPQTISTDDAISKKEKNALVRETDGLYVPEASGSSYEKTTDYASGNSPMVMVKEYFKTHKWYTNTGEEFWLENAAHLFKVDDVIYYGASSYYTSAQGCRKGIWRLNRDNTWEEVKMYYRTNASSSRVEINYFNSSYNFMTTPDGTLYFEGSINGILSNDYIYKFDKANFEFVGIESSTIGIDRNDFSKHVKGKKGFYIIGDNLNYVKKWNDSKKKFEAISVTIDKLPYTSYANGENAWNDYEGNIRINSANTSTAGYYTFNEDTNSFKFTASKDYVGLSGRYMFNLNGHIYGSSRKSIEKNYSTKSAKILAEKDNGYIDFTEFNRYLWVDYDGNYHLDYTYYSYNKYCYVLSTEDTMVGGKTVFHEIAFTGDYGSLYNAPDGAYKNYDRDVLFDSKWVDVGPGWQTGIIESHNTTRQSSGTYSMYSWDYSGSADSTLCLLRLVRDADSSTDFFRCYVTIDGFEESDEHELFYSGTWLVTYTGSSSGDTHAEEVDTIDYYGEIDTRTLEQRNCGFTIKKVDFDRFVSDGYNTTEDDGKLYIINNDWPAKDIIDLNRAGVLEYAVPQFVNNKGYKWKSPGDDKEFPYYTGDYVESEYDDYDVFLGVYFFNNDPDSVDIRVSVTPITPIPTTPQLYTFPDR